MVVEDLKNAKTRVYAFFSSSPSFLIEKKNLESNWFLKSKYGG